MLWPITQDCGCAFEDLFTNQWNVNTIQSTRDLNRHMISGIFGRLPDLLNAKDSAITLGYSNWLIQPGERVVDAAFWPRCLEVFQELSATQEILDRTERFCARFFRSEMIGAHLRRGDFLCQRPHVAGNTSIVLGHLDDYLLRCPKAGIFLCTDERSTDQETSAAESAGIVEIFSRRYGNRLVRWRPRSLDRSTPEAIQDALIDLLLLRQSTCFVGTKGSSFSELAVLGREVPSVFCGEGLQQYLRSERFYRWTGIFHFVQLAGRLYYGREIPFAFLWRRIGNKYRRYTRRYPQWLIRYIKQRLKPK